MGTDPHYNDDLTPALVTVLFAAAMIAMIVVGKWY
jgi:hypothetical protein